MFRSLSRALRGSASAAALVCAAVAQPAAATILFSDDFNAENGGVFLLNHSSFAQWTSTNGFVDLIGNGAFDLYPGNGLYVDMDGTAGDAGKLASIAVFTLTPGEYALSFDLGNNGSGSNTLIAAFEIPEVPDVFFEYVVDNAPTLTRRTLLLVTDRTLSDVRIVFEALGGDNAGPVIDNVELSRVVPEPSTWALSALGLLGAGLLVRRRQGAAYA